MRILVHLCPKKKLHIKIMQEIHDMLMVKQCDEKNHKNDLK